MTIENDHDSLRAGLSMPAEPRQDLAANGLNRSQTLYRKWRSQTFDQLVGQDAITRTLKNAIASGRVAHAYLFCGPRGTGKTSTGRLLAKAVNCLDPDPQVRPCDRCEACRSIAEGRALDLIEIDAASNRGIDEVRDLRDKINFQPSFLKKKVYIIDEVHMMTEAAFNALLKTLEEPPAHALFILATTDPQDIPATVLSRCQRFDFQRIGLETIAARLAYVCEQEGVPFEPSALDMVARQATGAMRDALSLLDQLIVFSGGRITLEAVRLMLGVMNSEAVADFVEKLATSDLSGGLEGINRLVQSGTDLKRFNRELVEHLRNLMLLKVNPQGRELTDLTAEALARLQDQAARMEGGAILGFLKTFSAVDYNLKVSPYGQLPLEIALMESLLQPAPALASPRPVAEVTPSRPVAASVSAATRPSAYNGLPASKPAPAPAWSAEPEQVPPVAPAIVSPPVSASASIEVTDTTPAPEAVSVGEVVRLELTSVTGLWSKAMDSIKAQNKLTAAMLIAARPVAVKGNRVSLAFAYPFHRNKINQDVTRRNVEDHLSAVVGQRVVIECVDESGDSAVLEDSPARSEAPSNSNEPIPFRPSFEVPASTTAKPPSNGRTKAALDIFNARLID